MARKPALLVLILTSAVAAAQQAPAAKSGATDGTYALFSAGRPNYGDQWLFGTTLGGFLQWNKWVGVDGRFVILPWGPSPNHQYAAVIGPRLAYTAAAGQDSAPLKAVSATPAIPPASRLQGCRMPRARIPSPPGG